MYLNIAIIKSSKIEVESSERLTLCMIVLLTAITEILGDMLQRYYTAAQCR